MIKINDLNKTYDKHTKSSNKVLHGISFTLPETGFVCILGPSGCGKTSLLNTIGGLDCFDSGKIICDGRDLKRCGSREMERERNASFGYIFQNYHLLPDHSVMYNVYIGMHSLDLTHREKIARAREVLKTVGMELYERRIVSELSGGQQQRVAIARAIARRPRVIFADEPTGNLDEENTVNICKLLRSISKTSLVIMVTHEERIARFFADRIIELCDGKIVNDGNVDIRGGLSYDSSHTIYSGELTEETINTEKLSIRLLYDSEATPEDLTVVLKGERIIIKHNGNKKMTCTEREADPVIREGMPPNVSFSEIDEGGTELTVQNVPMTRAGRGISFGMLINEARHILTRAGTKSLALRIFLILLSALTVFTVGDMLTVSHLDPHNFVTCDSRLLLVSVDRGAGLDSTELNAVLEVSKELRKHLTSLNMDIEFLPFISQAPVYKETVFTQLNSTSVLLNNLSYLPLSKLDEGKIIMGRAPEASHEIVVDRWVLENLLKKDGVLQNGISDVSHFMNKSLSFSSSGFTPEIVGICDTGEPTIYMSLFGLCAADTRGENMIPLSELREILPDEFGSTVIDNDQCIIIETNAGAIWGKRIGREYNASSESAFTIVGSYPYSTPITACIAINDGMEQEVLNSILDRKFYICTENKEAMKNVLSDLPSDLASKIRLTVEDRSGDQWAEQRTLVRERVSSRMIVTVTVMVVCAVMLWLLQRSRTRARTGMIAVYRLLCIPGRKLISVFIAEVIILSVSSALPAAALTFIGMRGASMIPELGYSAYLPIEIAVLAYAGILLFHLLAAVLPVASMLRVPPARLAAKYDF
ncbi:MAG: ATP-binding cassette domain-containing protein [Clostridia bacterium]|nr:ATP-binding cassette domain-containing protein [Clostridia bacterium]